MSFSDLVNYVDTFSYGLPKEHFRFLAHDGNTLLGYVTPEIALKMGKENYFQLDQEKKSVSLIPTLDSFEKRNDVFQSIGASWRKEPEFHRTLDRAWRNELYVVYNPTSVPYFLVERAFSVLLGVVTYGVHINGYIPSSKSNDGKLKLWIPRRARTKPTYPLMLDNMVAGGIGYPLGAWDTVAKECWEEASLEEKYVKQHTKAAGIVSYMYQPNGEQGHVQPEVQFIYDMEFDNETDVVPTPEDGEVDNFSLMDFEEVLLSLRRHEFKPNCGLVLIDFFIRHGYIDSASENHLLDVVCRCHRKLPFPTI